MAISIGDNILYQGSKPLDSRIVKATVSEMVAMPESTLYDGIRAYVTESKKYYVYRSTNTADSTLGKWRTETPAMWGNGYAECSTATATTNKTASITNFTLTNNGVVVIRFANDVNGGATLNISSTGNIPIYYQGSAIKNGVVLAGDVVTMAFANSRYEITNIERTKSLEDLRTDRRLIWHDEFDTLDSDKWVFVTDPEIDGIPTPRWSANPDLCYVENSSLYLKRKDITKDGVTKTVEGLIYSKNSFRNCLIEFKCKGLAGAWLETMQLTDAPNKFVFESYQNPPHNHLEIDIAEYYWSDIQHAYRGHYNLHYMDTNGTMRMRTLQENVMSKDDYHIYGLDMTDTHTFKVYIDGALFGTLSMEESDCMWGRSILNDLGLNVILSPTTTVSGEDADFVIDWIRVYSNADDSEYEDRSIAVESFVNVDGDNAPLKYEETWIANPIDSNGDGGVYLKWHPSNTYICPKINKVSLRYENVYSTILPNSLNRFKMRTSKEALNMDSSNRWILEIETEIGRFRAFWTAEGNENSPSLLAPAFLTSHQTDPTVLEAFAEIQTKMADTTKNYAVKINDVLTGEAHYVLIANQRLFVLPESYLLQMNQ